jgi:hypothetical protein
LEERVDIGHVVVEADDIGQGHACLAQHGFDVGQRLFDLAGHVVLVDRVAVGVG